MRASSPLWPAQLQSIRIDSDDPRLISFYRRALGMTPTELDDGTVLCGRQREGSSSGEGLPDAAVHGVKVQTEISSSPATACRNEPGTLASPARSLPLERSQCATRGFRWLCSGAADRPPTPDPANDLPAARLPGRLQHVVRHRGAPCHVALLRGRLGVRRLVLCLRG